MKSMRDTDRLPIVRMLLSLGSLDLLFSDLYLQRAESVLAPACTREAYLQMRRDRDRLPHFAAEMRRATQHDDWGRVRSLAEEASTLRARISQTGEVFQLAEAIYGPRVLHAKETALALGGVSLQPLPVLEAARHRVVAQLASLADQDSGLRDFYRARSRYFESLTLSSGGVSMGTLDASQIRKRVLDAVEAGDFAAVKSLTSSIALDVDHSAGPPSRAHVQSPGHDEVRRLAEPFPGESQRRAAELGLSIEVLPPAPELNRYLACPCVEMPTFPTEPRGEHAPAPEWCTCGHLCPPEIGPMLREDLDFLMAHPFVSSAGVRYLPWFGAESMLVESFPESEPDARTGLLRALDLPKRRGLSRIRIEDALLRHGPGICANLDLDPTQFVLACIPFDAYARLSGPRAWGRDELWTHFDGYQLTRDLGLWALFGGHVRYGGPENLSSLAREYDSDRLTARFVLLRRQRFLVRQGSAGGPSGAP